MTVMNRFSTLYVRIFVSLLLLTSGCGTPITASPKITVVGAGLAGLTTAYRLQQLGYDVEVYEARSRPGGRVCTAFFGTSYEELGGKNLYDGGDAENILALIKELGLSATPYTFNARWVYALNGHVYHTLFLDGPVPSNDAFDKLNIETAGAQNLAEVIDVFLKDHPVQLETMKILVKGYEGSPANQLDRDYLDLFQWMYELVYNNDQEIANGQVPTTTWCSVDGGNYRLVEALEKVLGSRIHYNSPLEKISQGPEKAINLMFRNGNSISSDYVVLALPCSTLRDVHIQDGILPADQTRAIDTLQYGTNAKMLIPVALRNKENPAFTVTNNMTAWFNQDRAIMTWYYGGESGIFDDSTVETLSQHLDEDLSAVRMAVPGIEFTKGITPELRHDALTAHYTRPIGISWFHEEFSKGSYSNYGVDQVAVFSELAIVCGETVRTVFRPVEGKIFFSGEHTALEHTATMEGAVESGERTARMIHCLAQ